MGRLGLGIFKPITHQVWPYLFWKCDTNIYHKKWVCVLWKFNGTSTPKGSYRAKTGDNDCNVNSSHYSLSTARCESIRYQAKSEQNVRQDLIPRMRHGEAALCTPFTIRRKIPQTAKKPAHPQIFRNSYDAVLMYIDQ